MENQTEKNQRTLMEHSSFEKHHQCPLCDHIADYFCSDPNEIRNYYKCSNCHSVFLDSKHFIDLHLEKKRYETHNNDVDDVRYQKFVEPITTAVQHQFLKSAKGLDYGCGTGPVASTVLKRLSYENISLYDPFFYPDKKCLSDTYDFIICCEVMEHFHNPNQEFSMLKTRLKDKGKLYCKTNLIENNTSVNAFQNWWYKDDPTHVFFYSEKTLKFIAHHFNFGRLTLDSNLITFG